MPSIIPKVKEISTIKLILLTLFAVLLVLFDSIGIFDPVKSIGVVIGNRIGADIAKQFDWFSERRELLAEKEELIDRIEQLEEEIVDLESKNTSLSLENREFDILKQQEQFSEVSKSKPALIIGKVNDKFGHVVINKGSEHGIKEGDYLILKNFLLGEIVQTNRKTSEARLIISQESVIPVTSHTNNTQGLSRGDVNRGLIMRDIPQVGTLEKGELIITSGVNSKFARGLILGKVNSIESNANQATKSAELDLVIDFNNLTEIFVIESLEII